MIINQQQIANFLATKLSKNTKKNYQKVLNRFLAWCKNDLHEDQEWLQNYENCLKQANLSNKSINLNITVIRLFYRFLGKNFERKRLKESPRQIDFLTPAEIKLLVDNSKGSFQGVLMFMADTGIRVGELVWISNWHYDLVNISKEWIVMGKGEKQRVVVISDKTLKKIKELYKDQFIFGKPWTVNMVQYHLKTLANWVGIKKRVHPHMLRHSLATRMLNEGVDISLVQRMLGHSSILTSLGYTHITNPRMVKAWSEVINQ